MTNLSAFLSASAGMRPGAAALHCGDVTTSFSVLSRDVARFADYLIDGGLRPDDRVAVMLPNRPELAVVLYGVLQAGGVVVLMSPSLSAREVEFCLTITGARILFLHPSTCSGNHAGGHHSRYSTRFHRQAWNSAVDLPGSPVVRSPCRALTMTPRSSCKAPAHTGEHESTELTQGSLTQNQGSRGARLTEPQPDDLVLTCVPLYEGFGLTCGLLATVYAGVTLALLPGFDAAKALKMISSERVTVFEGTPAMSTEMLLFQGGRPA